MDCLSISRPSDNRKIFFSKNFRFFRKNAVFIRSGECKKYFKKIGQTEKSSSVGKRKNNF